MAPRTPFAISPEQSSPIRLTDALVLGAWVGLVSGLLEAGVTYATRFAPYISAYRKSSELAFWVLPLVYGFVFLLAAVPLALLSRWVRKIPAALQILGVLGTVGCYLVISYPSMIHPVGGLFLSAGIAAVLCRAVRGCEEALLAFLRRRLLCALLLVALVGGSAHGWVAVREYFAVRSLPAARPNAPNVLVIVVDALRGDRLSSAGYARGSTPNLDAFGRQGVQYDFAFSTAPWSTPSHNTMLTGRFAFEHQMDYPVPNLRHGFPYLPQVLARYGYRSALFSANVSAVTQEYLDAGFQHHDVYTVSTTWNRTSLVRKIIRLSRGHSPDFLSSRTKRAATVTRPFMAWAARNPDRPFFALLNLMDLHDRRRWQRSELVLADAPEPAAQGDEVPGMTSQGGNQEIANRSYDEAVSQVDADVGLLLEELSRRGLARNTLIIITSDHGDSTGQHGFAAHASSVYIEQLHVPLLLRWPEKLPAGVRVTRPVSLAALPATVLHLLELPAALPGRPWPLAETPSSNGDSARGALLAEFNTLEWGPFLKSLLNSRWHYILNLRTGKEELYEWPVDRGELRNLAGSPQLQPVLEEFRKEMEARFPSLSAPRAAATGR